MNSGDNTSSELTEIQQLGDTMARIVSGGNYVAAFNCTELGGVRNLDDAVTAINKRYPKSKLQKDDTTSVKSWDEAWQEIDESIWYGVDANDGDEPNRPRLTQEAIEQLRKDRDHMKVLLNRFVDEKSIIYTFGWSPRLKDYISLDDYVVMWSYRFIIINSDGKAYLLHGSSSD